MRRRALITAGLALFGAGALAAGPPAVGLRERIRHARAAAERTPSYEQLGNGGVALITGDSTARGTGAETPELSLAGRIGAAAPTLRIINRGENEARFADVVEQLEAAPALPYRFVLIMAGANDVLSLSAPARVECDLRRALTLARTLSDRVVLMALPNVGHAPLLPWPVNRWLTRHARRLQQRVRAAAAASRTTLVNLYFEGNDDPFARDPARYIAADGIHPSAAGYELWYQALLEAQPYLLLRAKTATT